MGDFTRTVTIDLNEYNELLSFKKNVKKKNVYTINNYLDYFKDFQSYKLLTDEEVFHRITKINEELVEKIKVLNSELDNLKKLTEKKHKFWKW